MRKCRQSTARNILVFMADSSDHITGKTGLTLTITASKDGAAFASISPTVTDRGSGWYNLALTTSHYDTLGDLALHITGTGADPTDLIIEVVSYNPQDGAYLGLTGIDDLETRLSAARAGYLDELAAANIPTDLTNIYNRIGAPAGASIAADLVVIDNFVDDLETRLSAVRAGYLDNLSAGAVALASVCTAGRLGELDAANLPADIDTLLLRLTATRAAYLDYLNTVNTKLPANFIMGSSVNTDKDDDIDAILTDTNELQTDWANGGRLDTLLNDIAKLTGYNVTRAGDVITIYEIDGVTVFRQYDLASGGRIRAD